MLFRSKSSYKNVRHIRINVHYFDNQSYPFAISITNKKYSGIMPLLRILKSSSNIWCAVMYKDILINDTVTMKIQSTISGVAQNMCRTIPLLQIPTGRILIVATTVKRSQRPLNKGSWRLIIDISVALLFLKHGSNLSDAKIYYINM